MSQPDSIQQQATAKPLGFKNILWATDFSASSLASLPVVVALARRYESRVYIAHIVVPTPYPLVSPEAVPYVEKLKSAASKRLAELSGSGEFEQIPHETLLGHGEVAEVLNRMVKEHQIDLVVVATHGRRGFRRSLLGSMAEEICRTSNCPVFTVGPHVARTAKMVLQQIVYPTDLSEESFSAAQYALSFALEYAAQLTILHVVPGTMQASARLLARAFRDELGGMIASEVRSWCEPDCLVESGDPAETILRIAKERKADLIVLGIRNPQALALQRVGNVAYRVMAEADCPVLAVRPWSKEKQDGSRQDR